MDARGNRSTKRFATLTTAAAISLLAVTVASGSPGKKRDRDCADFSNQASAQAYFVANGGSPSYNFDSLDGDGDGVACESLPCPCSTVSGGDPPTPPPAEPSRQAATVISVIDGDTIKVLTRGTEEDVRLIGIDTPETYPEEECAGRKATRSLQRMLKPGDEVELVADPTQADRDVYGRMLRYVERAGADVGAKQVRAGWAQVYVYDKLFARVAAYRKQRKSADRHNRGAWKRCNGKFHKALK